MKIAGLFILLFALLPPVFAQDSAPIAVACRLEGMLLRESPGGAEIGQLVNQTRLRVLQRDVWDNTRNEWAQVEVLEGEFAGATGWVRAALIETLPMIYPVIASSLNVRAAPNTQAEIVGELSRGTPVEFLGHETIFNRAMWIYVRQPDSGLTGWVVSNYLENGDAARECTPILLEASPATPIQAVVWGDFARLRPAPSNNTNVGIITELPEGTRVTILESRTGSDVEHSKPYGNEGNYYLYLRGYYEDEWLYVQVTGTDLYGWVHYAYSLVPLSTQVRVIVNELHVRAAPGLESALVGSLAFGECVTLQDSVSLDGKGWLNIGSGWISRDFVELCD